MKLAQVEFAAVISAVFARCRVAPSLAGAVAGEVLGGERLEEARRLLRGCVEDSGFQTVTLAMRRPEDVVVQFEER